MLDGTILFNFSSMLRGVDRLAVHAKKKKVEDVSATSRAVTPYFGLCPSPRCFSHFFLPEKLDALHNALTSNVQEPALEDLRRDSDMNLEYEASATAITTPSPVN